MKKRWWIILLILAAAAVLFFYFGSKETADPNAGMISYTVDKGDIEMTVTGSGSLMAEDEWNKTLQAGLLIDTVEKETGDFVKTGEVIAMIDPESLEERKTSLITQIAAFDMELFQQQRNKMTENILSYTQGRVKAIFAEAGDSVSDVMRENEALMLISVDGEMQMNLNGKADVGERLRVVYDGGEEKALVTESDGESFTLRLSDEKAPYQAAAKVYREETLIGEGTLEIGSPVAVVAGDGVVKKVNVKLNDKISMGKKLMTLEEEVMTEEYKSKLEQREALAEDLAEISRYIADPVIRAEKDGVIFSLMLAEDAYTNDAPAYALYTGGACRMTIMADELDIAKLCVGQDAQIRIDAYEGEVFAAKVSRISQIGTASMSITEYAVELELAADERLMIGMNGNASILAGGAKDVLLVPLEAIGEDAGGEYVMIGEEKRYIETGLSDGSFAEVVNGLSQGEVISYKKTGSFFSQMMEQRQQIMSGGMNS
ncbi:MAG: hypothetical protein IKM38_06300 [Christensenellaceae bacterium]|nr:hypothetical protein [Christensenellaceae bacterium]